MEAAADETALYVSAIKEVMSMPRQKRDSDQDFIKESIDELSKASAP